MEDDSTSTRDTKSLISNKQDEVIVIRGEKKMSSILDPSKFQHRLIFLVFMSFLGFGNYFVYDTPAALQAHFLADMDLTMTKYSLFYSIYSYPNIVLCFLGGFLIDRIFGLRWGAIIFSILILIGHIVFSLGVYMNELWLALVGRFIFGLGGENLAVCQNLYGVSWFKGKELNMVLGLQLGFSRVGSTAVMNSLNPLYKYIGQHTSLSGSKLLGSVNFLAGFTLVFSLTCALVCYYMDKRATRILKKDETKSGEVVNLSDVKTYPLTFWIISILCVTYYVSIFPFISLGTVFFERKWNMTATSASFLDSLSYIVAAVAAPPVGLLIDKTGKNLYWVFISVILTLGMHALMAFSFINPYVSMVFLGLGYSILACCLWPLPAYIISEHKLGTAYGIMQSIQNAGLAAIPTLAGVIIDSKGFLHAELLYIGMLALSLFVVIFLYLTDIAKGGILNLSSKERALIEDKNE